MKKNISIGVLLLILLIFIALQIYQSDQSFEQIKPDSFSTTNLNETEQALFEKLSTLKYRRSLRDLESLVDDQPIFTIHAKDSTLSIFDRGIIKMDNLYYLIIFEDSEKAKLFEDTLKDIPLTSDTDRILLFDYLPQNKLDGFSEDEMITLAFDMSYNSLPDVHPESVVTIKASQAIEGHYSPQVTEIDGDLLYATWNQESVTLIREGKLSFSITLPYNMESRRLSQLFTANNNIYIVLSYMPYATPESNVNETLLLHLDQSGNLIKEIIISDPNGSRFKHVFVTENDEIISVGETLIGEMTDVVISKFDLNGDLLLEKTFGGSDFDYCESADYYDGTIYISGWTNSKDGSLLSHESNDQHVNFLMAIDEEGNKKWMIHPDICFNNILVVNNQLLATSYEHNNDIFIYGLNGDYLDKRYLPLASQSDYKRSKSGGFYTKVQRPIKPLPQPMIISSIWMDYEGVIEKYDSDFKMIWRRSFDLHPDDIRDEPIYILD